MTTPTSDFDKWRTAVKAAAEVLKVRFPNLTVSETIDLAGDIVKVVVVVYS